MYSISSPFMQIITSFDKIDASFTEATVHTVCVMSALQRFLPGPWKGDLYL